MPVRFDGKRGGSWKDVGRNKEKRRMLNRAFCGRGGKGFQSHEEMDRVVVESLHNVGTFCLGRGRT